MWEIRQGLRSNVKKVISTYRDLISMIAARNAACLLGLLVLLNNT